MTVPGQIVGRRAPGYQSAIDIASTNSILIHMTRNKFYFTYLLTYLHCWLVVTSNWYIKPLDVIAKMQRWQDNDDLAAIYARTAARHVDW